MARMVACLATRNFLSDGSRVLKSSISCLVYNLTQLSRNYFADVVALWVLRVKDPVYFDILHDTK